MKKNLTLFAFLALVLVCPSCKKDVDDNKSSSDPLNNNPPQKSYTITATEGYTDSIIIDEEAKTITLSPDAEKIEYTISGDFEGQIINKQKGTVIILNNANISNKEGKAAIYGELKTEIKNEKDSVNTITVTGTGDGNAAVSCEKTVEIGGSGKCTITCENAHGVKASKITLKGSGNYTFDAGDDSSALNCNEFIVEEEKTFTANLKDSKNGIKADESITIASGTFNFENITKTALKTDTSKDDPEVEHFIKIDGGTFSFTNCKKIYDTEDGGFSKADVVIGDFE